MSAFGFPPPNDPGLPLPVGAAQVWSAQASASTPTLWLDTYYDAAIFASKTAAINAAIGVAIAGHSVLECQGGRVYLCDTGEIDYPPNSPLIIEGRGCTFRTTYGHPLIFFFQRTADDQTWRNLSVRDITFDANNATATNGQAVVGNKNNFIANAQQRCNFQFIYFPGCQWINVHTAVSGDGTAPVSCFELDSSQTVAGQPQAQNTIYHVHIGSKDTLAYARGGNYGFVVNGVSTGGSAAVNVYLDQIYLNFDWDSGVVQNGTFVAGGNQIGSVGYGNYCEVCAIIANGGDVNLEIDGMQTAHIWGQSTDARNACYFARNFHAPPDLISQRYIYHGCESRVVNQTVTSANPFSPGFVTGYQADALNPGFGEVVLDDCKHVSYAATMQMNGSAIQLAAALINAVTIVGKFVASYPNVNDANAGGIAFDIRPSTVGTFTLSGGDLRVRYAGTGGAGGIINSVRLDPQVAGCVMIVDLGAVRPSSTLASQGNGRTRGLQLGATSGSIRGRIRTLGWESFSGGDTTPRLFLPAASTTTAIDGRFVIDELDLRKDPQASPLLFNNQIGMDVTNQAKIAIRSANMPTYPIASVAVSATNFAAAAFTTAVGNQYIGGLPAEVQFATGTGAAVTAIDASKDGTTYENVWTQASGALSNSVIVPVEQGDFVRVTFATTQPTGRVRYRRAQ